MSERDHESGHEDVTESAEDGELGELIELYFKIQSDFDITKHMGSLEATDELVELCGIDASSHVLDVGCGVGATPAYLAKNVGCRVTGIDLREGMIARSVERAEREGVSGLTTFQVADVATLPFDDDTFDVVMCESVLALVDDQRAALREMLRVLKPGGRLGATEATWMKLPSEELLQQLKQSIGRLEAHSPAGWRELFEDAGFCEAVVDAHEIDLKTESLSRVKRYGLGHLVRAWGHMMKSLLTEPEYRRFLKGAAKQPRELLSYWGYMVGVANKPST
jgi:ubiquinone/menaquinone biosynthesis C-methylase UbiE